jgi:ribosome-associated heat shock protein Hsp15
MAEKKSVRIDKFLWAVRIFKTRSLASEACKKGKIIINNVQVKPSRQVLTDEVISVSKPPVTYTYKVIDPVENRIPAKEVPIHLEDLTPEEEKSKLYVKTTSLFGYRERGLGRPTKKDRRKLEKLKEDIGER